MNTSDEGVPMMVVSAHWRAVGQPCKTHPMTKSDCLTLIIGVAALMLAMWVAL